MHPVGIFFSSIAKLGDISALCKVSHYKRQLARLESKDSHPHIGVLLCKRQDVSGIMGLQAAVKVHPVKPMECKNIARSFLPRHRRIHGGQLGPWQEPAPSNLIARSLHWCLAGLQAQKVCLHLHENMSRT